MPHPERLTVSRRIAAPAHRIFAIVSDPRVHVEIDASGMLVAALDAEPLRSVDDIFEMDMDREPLGAIRVLDPANEPIGEYKVICTVTSIVPDVEVAWTVAAPGKRSPGHIYGYHLEPISEIETEVTSYCDWSAVSQEFRERFAWPVVPALMLERSLVNLDRIASRPAYPTAP